jgi:hypothetical protein
LPDRPWPVDAYRRPAGRSTARPLAAAKNAGRNQVACADRALLDDAETVAAR